MYKFAEYNKTLRHFPYKMKRKKKLSFYPDSRASHTNNMIRYAPS